MVHFHLAKQPEIPWNKIMVFWKTWNWYWLFWLFFHPCQIQHQNKTSLIWLKTSQMMFWHFQSKIMPFHAFWAVLTPNNYYSANFFLDLLLNSIIITVFAHSPSIINFFNRFLFYISDNLQILAKRL